MDSKAVADAYRQGSIENAPPIKIIRMLYQGALRFLTEAIAAGADSVIFRDRVARTDQIVTELRLALVADADPSLCENLENLYLFVESCLIDAMRNQTTEPLASARKILTTLGEAWKEVEITSEQ
ncbi:MAG: flagellar protein FliS [Chlamydiales bacterium]|jgi:flagellar protein FliS